MLTIALKTENYSNDKDCMFSKCSIKVEHIPFDISSLPASCYDLEGLTLKQNANLPSFTILCWCLSCKENQNETWIKGEITKSTIGPKKKMEIITCDNYHSDDDDGDDSDHKDNFVHNVPVDAISTYYTKLLSHRKKWGSCDAFSRTVYLNGCYCKDVCDCKPWR